MREDITSLPVSEVFEARDGCPCLPDARYAGTEHYGLRHRRRHDGTGCPDRNQRAGLLLSPTTRCC